MVLARCTAVLVPLKLESQSRTGSRCLPHRSASTHRSRLSCGNLAFYVPQASGNVAWRSLKLGVSCSSSRAHARSKAPGNVVLLFYCSLPQAWMIEGGCSQLQCPFRSSTGHSQFSTRHGSARGPLVFLVRREMQKPCFFPQSPFCSLS